MPKGKNEPVGMAIMKNKAALIRTKKQQLREKKRLEKEQAGLIPDAGLSSILDVNNLDDFLDTVSLAQRSFATEKGAAVIIDRDVKEVKDDYDPELLSKYRTMQIPRRPKWDGKRSPEEQDKLERLSFLEWRRNVAKQVEHDTGAVAPFEKNLEVWRQLWRVVERSDCLVQIVDCRNPLLFRCPDVDVYVKEVNPCKRSVLIVNKADLIPEHLRIEWGRYFDSVNLKFVFFSAKASSSIIEKELAEKEENVVEEKEEEEEEEESEEEEEESEEEPSRVSYNAFASLMSDDDESDDESDEKDSDHHEEEEEQPADQTTEVDPAEVTDLINAVEAAEAADVVEGAEVSAENTELTEERLAEQKRIEEARLKEEATIQEMKCTEEERYRYRIHSRDEVLSYLEEVTHEAYEDVKKHALEQIESGESDEEWVDRHAIVGMLGFPNVGKSSLINVLLGVSATSHGSVRVAVGATPGKTKHLQTAILSDTLMLCDCPGLVFPVFMNTKADLLFNGVLPASNMRNYIDPITLVCQRVEREELERVYHIKLPRNPLDPPDAVPHPRQLLTAMCTVRGYMASNHSGVNEPRGAIVILKDVLNGVLTWCIPPPSLGILPTHPLALMEDKEVAADPTTLTKEVLAEITPQKEENGGRHKPRQRKMKERSGKKVHKVKKDEPSEELPQYHSMGAYKYI